MSMSRQQTCDVQMYNGGRGGEEIEGSRDMYSIGRRPGRQYVAVRTDSICAGDSRAERHDGRRTIGDDEVV